MALSAADRTAARRGAVPGVRAVTCRMHCAEVDEELGGWIEHRDTANRENGRNGSGGGGGGEWCASGVGGVLPLRFLPHLVSISAMHYP